MANDDAKSGNTAAGNSRPGLSAGELTNLCGEKEVSAHREDKAQVPVLPGQTRGIQAVEFGLSLKRPYFNITVSGASRTGKTTVVKELAIRQAATESPSTDICITANFSEPTRPGVLYLPSGSGSRLNQRIDGLLTILDKQIPDLIAQPAVKAHIQELNENFNQQAHELSRELEGLAQEKGFFLQTSAKGTTLIPLKDDGKPMTDEDFISLEMEKREAIKKVRSEVLKKMSDINPRVLELEKERQDAVEDYIEQAIRVLVGKHMADLRKEVADHEGLTAYLDALEAELVDKRFLFLAEAGSAPFGTSQVQALREQFSQKCKLNVVVNRASATAAPVITESNPNYNNLIGGVDFVEEKGVLKTDFNQIRAGALIQASGGYLIIQAQDMMQYPVAYMALKRALRTGEIVLKDQFTEMGWRSGSHLEPDPIKVDTKVIMVGDDQLIQLLYAYDDEFAGLFKIHGDFSQTLTRNEEVLEQLVTYLSYHARRHDLLPVSNSAITRLVEESSRSVSHQNRLSAQVNELLDILIEADLVARKTGQTELTREIVEMALKLKKARHGKIEEMVKREISEGTILLDFRGRKPGQVNGLAVYQVGRVAFGIPTRITAQAYAGRQGLINIEREADLSGRIHTKGMLILNGYMGNLFARKHPLALSVSITFEQSYGGIEGDSATAAEFLAVLSAINQVSIKQSIAITGSMNQHGEIQPIGGVNEKISGFYQFVKENNFPEDCGVVIPWVNKVNLLLDDEIIQAVEEGKFRVYPVRQIEEAVEIFMDIPAGVADADGTYPPGSAYALATARLAEFMPKRRPSDEAGQEDETSNKAQNEGGRGT